MVKALTFEELFFLRFDEKADYINKLFKFNYLTKKEYESICKDKMRKNEIVAYYDNLLNHEYYHFIKAAFSPKIIPEKFVGWTLEKGEYHCQDNKLNLINIYEYKIYYYSLNGSAEIWLPKTIGEFISNCKQCNIELFWKV